MNTLFLIDNGRAIAYDLTQSQGVVIGLLADQLVVATATGFASDATDEPGGATSGDAGGGDGSATNTDRYVFSVEPKSQYSLTYNPTQKALGVIGTGDIVINMQGPSGNHDCQNPFISLDRGRIVRIRRVNNQLEITTVRS